MIRGKAIYEGKAKILYETDDPDLLVLYFKDDATAFNRKKTGQWEGKGVVNCKISAILTQAVAATGVATHFVEQLSDREHLVKRVQIVPVEVVLRNCVAGSLSRRLGIPEGTEISRPFVEFYYKSDELDDPMVLPEWILEFGWATAAELDEMRRGALAVNQVVGAFMAQRGIRLVDFKIEFGRAVGHHAASGGGGQLLLADEITPDGSRLWELGTNRKLDKDRFRHDLGGVAETYVELLHRVEKPV